MLYRMLTVFLTVKSPISSFRQSSFGLNKKKKKALKIHCKFIHSTPVHTEKNQCY